MIVYLLLALIILGLYFATKGRIDKKRMLKTAQIFTNKNHSEPDIKKINNQFLGKKIYVYRYDKKTDCFKSLHQVKKDIKAQDLDYKEQIRFKSLMNIHSNEFEYFKHKDSRHLLYPIASGANRTDLLLIETSYESFNDLFNRKPSPV